MCGRFAVTAADAVEIAEDLAREFGIQLAAPQREELGKLHRPRYNIAPRQLHWVLDQKRLIRHGPWGFRQARRSNVLFNARAETVHQKPTFAEAFHRSRAILFCDAFYEWNSLGKHEPWVFRPEGLSFFALAALVESPRPAAEHSSSNAQLDSAFCVITTPPNEIIGKLHPRMPALLGREASREWLDANTAPQRALALLRPAPTSAMSGQRIGSYVNDPSNDGPRCFEPPRQTSLF
jgi:putative SOS response-associated peptidase YedK